MRRRTMLLKLLVLAVAAQLPAQTPSAKFRISGKTVNASTGQVLAGAEVWIAKAGQFDQAPQRMLTGDDGGFTFTGLEPGKYELAGQGNGFRTQGYEQHGMYLSAVVVGPGLNSENVIFRLRPDARIVGTIVDDERDAVPNAMVYLFRTDASGGLRQTYRVSQAISDDRGCYRFPHLESGRYFLAVNAQPWYSSLGVEQVNLSGESALEQKGEGERTPAERTVFDVIFPTTFYPGVTDSASASPIALGDGQEFTADFTLSAIPALRVRLNHLNADPERPRYASLKQRLFGITVEPPGQRPVPVNDSVEIRGVAPGRYVLDVTSYTPTPVTRSMLLHLTADRDFDADRAPAMPPISGTVRTNGGVTLRPQAFVRLWNSRTGEILDSQIRVDGQFSFEPDFLAPGNYSVFLINGESSIIGRLSATGAQVTGHTIQVTGSRQIQLTIDVPGTLSKINGVARRNGQPFPGAMIVLVPENPEINLGLFRRDQSDSDGTFTLRDVLPGRYRIFAIENAWNLEWADPAFLKTHLEHAQSAEVLPNKTYQTEVNVE